MWCFFIELQAAIIAKTQNTDILLGLKSDLYWETQVTFILFSAFQAKCISSSPVWLIFLTYMIDNIVSGSDWRNQFITTEKGQVVCVYAMKAYGIRGRWHQLHTPTALPPGKEPLTPTERGWVDPSAGLDASEKGRIYCPYQESNHDSSVVQSIT